MIKPISFQLRPLHRRDLPGWLSAQLRIGNETLFLEFRMNEKWDRQLPAPCVLLHRKSLHPGDGTPCPEILVTNNSAIDPTEVVDLRPGESFETGIIEDLFGFYAKITLSKIDVEQRIAFINVYIREKRQIEPQGTPYGEVTSDGGGWVWTPGRGFVKVPPRSPLLNIVELLGDVELFSNHESKLDEHVNQLSIERLTEARDKLSAIISSRSEYKITPVFTNHH
ncbi:hypothetical protein GZH53_01110 [Flavihumibacter sp. R14]|nr:hypothetical protein [Flavihumibacter soli]